MKGIVDPCHIDVNGKKKKKSILLSKSGDFPRPSSHADRCARRHPRRRYVPSFFDRLCLITASASLDRHCSLFKPPSYKLTVHHHCMCPAWWVFMNPLVLVTQLIYRLERQGPLGLYLFPPAFPQQPLSYALLSSNFASFLPPTVSRVSLWSLSLSHQ